MPIVYLFFGLPIGRPSLYRNGRGDSIIRAGGPVAELVDAQDLKSWAWQRACRFESDRGHFYFIEGLELVGESGDEATLLVVSVEYGLKLSRARSRDRLTAHAHHPADDFGRRDRFVGIGFSYLKSCSYVLSLSRYTFSEPEVAVRAFPAARLTAKRLKIKGIRARMRALFFITVFYPHC